jgi:hypothetical protein
MIPKEIIDFVSKDETIKIVRNDPKWIQLLKSEKTNKDSIINFCLKFPYIQARNMEDYIHISDVYDLRNWEGLQLT